MSLPVVALLGRPNVGKSTLFKRLTKEKALIGPTPGLTRDRRYGVVRTKYTDFILMDTAGFNPDDQNFANIVAQQTTEAINEADVLILMVDGKYGGIHPLDAMLADQLRPINKPLLLVVNKCETEGEKFAAFEFFSLGLGEPIAISATHGNQVDTLLHALAQSLLPAHDDSTADADEIPKIAFLGKPNVGKFFFGQRPYWPRSAL